MSDPWLSVVMPTYNGADFVADALESVAAQNVGPALAVSLSHPTEHHTDGDVEVIVVDDGSDDETLEIVGRYQSRLRLTIVQEPHGGNWIRRTNQGMRLARGEFITWLHQDDVWFPGRLRELRRLAGVRPTPSHPAHLPGGERRSRGALAGEGRTAGFLFHPALFLDRRGRCVGRWSCPMVGEGQPTQPDVLRHLLVQSFLAASVPVFRRSAIEQVGLVDERLWFCGDWEYWLRLVQCLPVAYSPRPLCGFRLHRDSLTYTFPERVDDVVEQYSIVFARHLEQRNGFPCPLVAPHLLGPHLGDSNDWFDPRAIADIACMARGSAAMNVALARLARGDLRGILVAVSAALGLKHTVWKYWNSSRLGERVMSRVRAGCYLRAAPFPGGEGRKNASLPEGEGSAAAGWDKLAASAGQPLRAELNHG